jgi:hypothetical protein
MDTFLVYYYKLDEYTYRHDLSPSQVFVNTQISLLECEILTYKIH